MEPERKLGSIGFDKGAVEVNAANRFGLGVVVLVVACKQHEVTSGMAAQHLRHALMLDLPLLAIGESVNVKPRAGNDA